MAWFALRRVPAVLAAVALVVAACGSGKHATPTLPATAVRSVRPTVTATSSGDGARGSASPVASPSARLTTRIASASPTQQAQVTATARHAAPTPSEEPASAPTASVAATVASTATTASGAPTSTTLLTPSPEATATPTAPATATAGSANTTLLVTEQGFGQASGASEGGYGFLAQNPRSDAALENSAYTVTGFDAGGTPVATEQGTIDVVLPGATLGVAGSLFPSDGATIASLDVTFGAGVAETLSTAPPSFTTADVTFFSDEAYPFVTGVIGNPLPAALQDLAVYAVLRDSTGAIVGGGSATLDFAPASAQTGISIYVAGAAAPATIKLYPAITRRTLEASGGAVPDDARDIMLAKWGWAAPGDGGEGASRIRRSQPQSGPSHYQRALSGGLL